MILPTECQKISHLFSISYKWHVPEFFRNMDGIFEIWKDPAILNENRTLSPIRKYATEAAVTDEIKRGTIDEIVRSRSSISRVKTIPAMGALKIPDTAPAAPHPISRVMFL